MRHTDHLSTRRIVAVLVALLAVATAACSSGDDGGQEQASGEDSVFAGRDVGDYTPKPDFVLTDTEGQPYDFAAETEGDVTFLYFGYTHCPDICPVHMSQLAEVLSKPDAPANVTVVLVTVDPERDTPEVLRDFLDQFDGTFVGLTGTQEELVAAQEAAGVTPAVKEENAEDPEAYTMGHAGQVLAYAPNGLNYTQYPFGSRQSQFDHDLPILASLTEPDADPQAATAAG
jgi:protein SCO1/2